MAETTKKYRHSKMKKFIDLGLPSGTLWASENEKGFFTFDKAVKWYKEILPTEDMLRELHDECKWQWNNKKRGYMVTGKNGNSIFLPTKGFGLYGKFFDLKKKSKGLYWSSTPYDSVFAGAIELHKDEVFQPDAYFRKFEASVRLVSKKIINIKNHEF